MRLSVKTSLALAILALIAASALLGSPWMNQRFHLSNQHPAQHQLDSKTSSQESKTAGSTREPAVSNSR
ncbi:hypothetical protein [Pseudomonas putida]